MITPALREWLIRTIDTRLAAAKLKTEDFATIVQRDAVGPGALIAFDGSTAPSPAKVLAHVDCFEGDPVVVNLVHDRWVVVGTFARHSVAKYWQRWFGPTGSGTTSSTTATDMPTDGGTMSMSNVIKRYDDTGIAISFVTTFWATATTTAETSVYIQGTPGTETASTFTPLRYVMGNSHVIGVSGARTTLDGSARGVIPAGNYTMTAQWRRGAAAATLSMNDADLATMTVDEYVLTV